MIFKGFSLPLLLALLLALLVGWVAFRFFQSLPASFESPKLAKKLMLFAITALLLAGGARSSLGRRPANVGDFAFSKSHLVNQLCLNTTYNLVYEYLSQKKAEKDPSHFYGRMDIQEMLDRVRKTSGIPKESCTNPAIPFLHYQKSPVHKEKPVNLVIIVEESLGAEYVGCLGGLPLTPYFDGLSKEGLLFTRMYATGTRTLRGLEAVIAGFLPTPAKSVFKLGLSKRNFFTIADLFEHSGYRTEFMYSGDSTFDNMHSFCLNNGFQQVYDEKDIQQPVFKGNWGVSDEDLFHKAHEIFKTHGEKPFFALLLTTSNHDPFEFPDDRIALYEQPQMTRNNAIKYADYALGKYFESAKKESYYRNTLFLIIGDHSTRLSGEDLVPIHKFHVPALIIGPEVQPGTFDRAASQIDMPSTLLELMGFSAEVPLFGRALAHLPDGFKGRAIIQYGEENIYIEEDQAVLHRPKKSAAQFVYRDGRLISTQLDPELSKTALAHALLPGYLYYNFMHRLPDQPTSIH
jgi:phosphoglycerol transferase MdoB-like AlkP superfamily enzyme